MSNLFTRIKNSIAADFHEVLDKKEEKNPIAMLNQYLRDCEKEVEKVKLLVDRQGILKEEFTKEYEQAKVLSEKRKYQADIALKAEEKELYEFAIREQVQYEERAVQLRLSLEKATSDLQELEQKYETMKHKLKDMYIKRMELMGRENVARANHRINNILNSNDATDSLNKFIEMENYIDRLENKVNTKYHQHTIDAKIAQLEKELQNEEKTVSHSS